MKVRNLLVLCVALFIGVNSLQARFKAPTQEAIDRYAKFVPSAYNEINNLDVNWDDRIEIIESFMKSYETLYNNRRGVNLDVTDTPGPHFKVEWYEDLSKRMASIMALEREVEAQPKTEKTESFSRLAQYIGESIGINVLNDTERALLMELKEFKTVYLKYLEQFKSKL